MWRNKIRLGGRDGVLTEDLWAPAVVQYVKQRALERNIATCWRRSMLLKPAV